MEKLLATVIQIKASDLHISVGQPPVIRHHGRMRKLDAKILDNDDTTGLMKSIAPDRCQQELQNRGGSDFAIEYTDGVRFRCAIFKQKGTVGMVMRRIPSQFLTFEQLRSPEAVRSLIVRPRGMLLVTGPTGSGKTTTLASMINFINDNYDRHIITLEDPIEYFHRHKKSTVNQREIGIDVPDFKEGIRRALRMDPDGILIRENKVYRIDSSVQTGRKHGMFLLDESLFRLWKEGLCDKEEVLLKSSRPNELAAKIAQAEKGLYDEDEEGGGDEDEDDEDEDDEEEEEPEAKKKPWKK